MLTMRKVAQFRMLALGFCVAAITVAVVTCSCCRFTISITSSGDVILLLATGTSAVKLF